MTFTAHDGTQLPFNIIDTPGIRHFALWGIKPEEVIFIFPKWRPQQYSALSDFPVRTFMSAAAVSWKNWTQSISTPIATKAGVPCATNWHCSPRTNTRSNAAANSAFLPAVYFQKCQPHLTNIGLPFNIKL